MAVIESDKFAINLPANVDKITEKRNHTIIDTIIELIDI